MDAAYAVGRGSAVNNVTSAGRGRVQEKENKYLKQT